MTPDRDAQQAILTLLAERGPDKTICPSEAARKLDAVDWRELMPAVHLAAAALAKAGFVELRQGGQPREAGTIAGAYRIAVSG